MSRINQKPAWHGLITDYFVESNNITYATPYTIYEIDARELITPYRIDLVAKWIYIDFRERNIKSDYGREIYIKHLEAFSDGSFNEPGTIRKNSQNVYLEDFDNLIDDVKNQGFDSTKSIVPIGANKVLLDGSHRAASCAYFNKKITVVEFPHLKRNYGYDFFKDRSMDDLYLDHLATTYCYLKPNVYIACLWPIAYLQNKTLDIERIINNSAKILYKKEIKLTSGGIRNLILQIYSHHDWSGNYKNRFHGSINKSNACYAGDGKMVAYAIECHSLETVLNIKQSIRDLYNIENHSIHITDNQPETLQIANLVFNKNSIHHLNFASLDKYKNTHELMGILKSSVLNNGHQLDDYVIDSSSVLSIYGIRSADDLDYLSVSKSDLSLEHELIDNHRSQLKYYKSHVDDIVHNPQNYFFFNNMKFLSLSKVIEMKENRNEPKDNQDIILAKSFIGNENNTLRVIYINVRKRLRRTLRKSKVIVFWCLSITRTKKPARWLYSKIISKSN